jgi:hypothetical protein
MDLTDWQDSGLSCDQYNCSNQGISAGCADIYAASLDCQWIDVTTVLDGNYTIRVTTNPYKRLVELDYNNNTAEVTIEISGDSVQVIDIEELKAKAEADKTKTVGSDLGDTPKDAESSEKNTPEGGGN